MAVQKSKSPHFTEGLLCHWVKIAVTRNKGNRNQARRIVTVRHLDMTLDKGSRKMVLGAGAVVRDRDP